MFGCSVCNVVTSVVNNVCLLPKIRGKGLKRSYNFKIDGQWLWDDAVKFAGWQHPAVRRSLLCMATFIFHVITIFGMTLLKLFK